MPRGVKFTSEKAYPDLVHKLNGAAKAIRCSWGVYQERLSHDIQTTHGIDFIGKLLPQLIEEAHDRKIRILDLGCGYGLFTDQIRNELSPKVDVYGVTINADIDQRRASVVKTLNTAFPDAPFSEKRNKKDTRQSIAEFRDFPEFDLIIDTFGEFCYEATEEKLEMIAKKLRPGGLFFFVAIFTGDEHLLEPAFIRSRFGLVLRQIGNTWVCLKPHDVHQVDADFNAIFEKIRQFKYEAPKLNSMQKFRNAVETSRDQRGYKKETAQLVQETLMRSLSELSGRINLVEMPFWNHLVRQVYTQEHPDPLYFHGRLVYAFLCDCLRAYQDINQGIQFLFPDESKFAKDLWSNCST